MGFSNGSSGSGSIATSADVTLNSPANGQVLTYNLSTQKWANGVSSAGLTAAKDTNASGALTMVAGTSANLTKFTGTLSGNRTVTLSPAAANAYFEFSFIETNFNGYSVTVTNGSFSHAFSYPTFVKYVNIAGTWERVL
jgi:hypothetical protein